MLHACTIGFLVPIDPRLGLVVFEKLGSEVPPQEQIATVLRGTESCRARDAVASAGIIPCVSEACLGRY